MLFAFVDESCRVRADDDCVYVLAAVLLHSEGLDHVRSLMDTLRYGKTPTVHWRTERVPRRSLIAQAVASIDFASVVAVSLHASAGRPERARRHCLLRLLPELSARGVETVVFESRREQDAADRAILTVLRRRGQVAAEMSVSWARASSDAALWTADVVAGVVTGWLGGELRWWPLLEERVTFLEAGEM
ncbi:hypothetical protein N5079_15765 [Planotetraspora sp. A-T 1434]|uniref:hypothetical protein n=1 Tax=Planotetraspora sp. A-T 1434 TaxID=2979219 RepID=UPI0021BE7F3C|nr:hypothetical protein [Planotetraspora sp. A-T 1434]MCT9931671.1 hypothetical protein [Planotetraspora sp. A-T 1434]